MASGGSRSYVVYQTMGAISVGLSGMVASLTMGYTSPALPSMQKDPDFEITDEDGSWIGAVMPACALLGSLAAGPILDKLGRKSSLLLLTFPFMLSWAIIAMAGRVSEVILGRMLGGACVGVQAVAGSVFMPETVQLELRNRMLIFPSALGTLGIPVGYAAGQFLSWRELAWLGCFLCLPHAILLIPLPETPSFLTNSGKRNASIAALNQLRENSKRAEKEQEELDENLKRNSIEKKVSFSELFRGPNLWPVSVGAALMLAQQITGINAVVFYSSIIFEAGGDWLDPNTSSTLLGMATVFSALFSMYFTSTYERRRIMSWSTIAVIFTLFILSVFFWAQEAGGVFSNLAKMFSFVPVVTLISYIFVYSIGWGPVPWIFLGEGMPSNVRGLAVAFVVSINWASAFLVTKSFQWCISILGIHYTFLSYAVITGVSSFFILQSMPETFEKSNAQMDKLYRENAKAKKQ